MMLVNLKLKDKLSSPPAYLTLLQIVRREEAEQAEKDVNREPELAPHVPSQQSTKNAKSCKIDQKVDKSKASQRQNFCFKCGLEGHYRPKCTNPTDPDKVNKRFIQFHLQGNGKGHSKEADVMPKKK